MAEQNWVYPFGPELTRGNAEMADLLGGKGANLAEMSRLGLPVPPGFTIATTACNAYFDGDGTPPPGLMEQVGSALAKVASVFGSGFGEPDNPLLVSVRSGARVSMPGMLDTVLNLGLNDETVEGLAECSADEKFAWDSYRRFIQMYGNVVLGVETGRFEGLIDVRRVTRGVELDADLDADDWRAITRDFRDLVEDETGSPFPQDPNEQLHGAIGAVFDSWHNSRAGYLPGIARHTRRMGNRSQYPGHGLRQYGKELCHRSFLYAQPS